MRNSSVTFKRAIHVMTINEFNIYNQSLEDNYVKILEIEETESNMMVTTFADVFKTI